jgi:fibronectin type III domain protein
MRRAIIIVLAALPAVALAITANVGQVLETTNFDAVNAVSYLNAAQCVGTATTDPLNLEWIIQPLSGVSFLSTGTYRIFASTLQPPTSGTDAGFCAETPNTSGTNPVTAGEVGSVPVNAQLQDLPVSGAKVAAAVGYGCDPTNEGKTIWICSHWENASGTKSGFASGKFLVQVAAPAAPVDVKAGSADSALTVNWSAGSGGADVDHYIVTATPVGSTTPAKSSGDIKATDTRLSGLTIGTEYTVVVVAYSKGGNPSDPSAPATGTPLKVEDYWDWYKLQGGTETGGCASGSAGLAALAGVAALLALRRRAR